MSFSKPRPQASDLEFQAARLTVARWNGRYESTRSLLAPDFWDESPVPQSRADQPAPLDALAPVFGPPDIEHVTVDGPWIAVCSVAETTNFDTPAIFRDVALWRLDRQGRFVHHCSVRAADLRSPSSASTRHG